MDRQSRQQEGGWFHLLRRIRDRTAAVAVIGLGQAGLFQAYELAAKGYVVEGYDTDTERVDRLAQGESLVPDVPQEAFASLVRDGRLAVTSDAGRLQDREILLISVPTTVDGQGRPRVDEVRAATRTIAENIAGKPLVIVKSTGYPGMTREVVAPILERRFGQAGVGFYLAFVPERGDAGNRSLESAEALPKVVGGLTPACSGRAEALYRELGGSVHPASGLEVAEMVKLHENVYRFINIAYANEVASLCRSLGIDPFEVVELASTKPFGFMPFTPGAGIGGLYLPVNTAYLLWTARRRGVAARVLESAVNNNDTIAVEVAALVERRLASLGKAPGAARVILLGLGYKRGSGDVRGSPSLAAGEAMAALGMAVLGMDPHVPAPPADLPFAWAEWDPARLDDCDAIVLLTDHAAFTPGILVRHMAKLIDLRGVSRRWAPPAAREAAAALEPEVETK